MPARLSLHLWACLRACCIVKGMNIQKVRAPYAVPRPCIHNYRALTLVIASSKIPLFTIIANSRIRTVF